MSDPTTPADLPELMEFNDLNAATMRARLRHGAAKFGALSWREDPYPDDRNTERLLRAVADLLHVVGYDTPMPDEARKRAADVANQAFMLADPERYRHD